MYILSILEYIIVATPKNCLNFKNYVYIASLLNFYQVSHVFSQNTSLKATASPIGKNIKRHSSYSYKVKYGT